MYQVGNCNCNVVLGEVSFSVDNDLEVVGNKGTSDAARSITSPFSMLSLVFSFPSFFPFSVASMIAL